MTTLTYIPNSHGDWCAIYIDNVLGEHVLYTEGHSIAVWEWLDILVKYDISMTYTKEVNGDWLEECGSFPTNFSDIPEEMGNEKTNI